MRSIKQYRYGLTDYLNVNILIIYKNCRLSVMQFVYCFDEINKLLYMAVVNIPERGKQIINRLIFILCKSFTRCYEVFIQLSPLNNLLQRFFTSSLLMRNFFFFSASLSIDL